MSQLANPIQVADDVEILRNLNLNYIRSVAQSDATWFDENLAESFLNTNPDGAVVDRAGFLQQIARKPSVTDLTGSDVQVRVLGDIGIVNSRTHFRKTDGSDGAGCYTDVYWKRAGRWRCVAAHVSRS